MRDACDEAPNGEIDVTSAKKGRTQWNVEHPEAGVRVAVVARSEEEARALAWRRWYGRDPTTEFDERLRAGFCVTDSGVQVK